MPYFIQNAFLNKFQLQSSNYGNIQDFDGTKGIIGLTPEVSAGTFTPTYTLGSTAITIPTFSGRWPEGTDTSTLEGNIALIGTSDRGVSLATNGSITIDTTAGAIGTIITGISYRPYLLVSDAFVDNKNGVNTVWKLNNDADGVLSVVKIYDNSANPTIWNPLIATENSGPYIPI